MFKDNVLKVNDIFEVFDKDLDKQKTIIVNDISVATENVVKGEIKILVKFFEVNNTAFGGFYKTLDFEEFNEYTL